MSRNTELFLGKQDKFVCWQWQKCTVKSSICIDFKFHWLVISNWKQILLRKWMKFIPVLKMNRQLTIYPDDSSESNHTAPFLCPYLQDEGFSLKFL